eukprot:scaffold1525_cov142-Cylindrotheca_fusiformis.AAC.133
MMHDEEMPYPEKPSMHQRQISVDRTVLEEESGAIELEALPARDSLCARVLSSRDSYYQDESVVESLQRRIFFTRKRFYLWVALVLVLLIAVITPSAVVSQRKSSAMAIAPAPGDNSTVDDPTIHEPKIDDPTIEEAETSEPTIDGTKTGEPTSDGTKTDPPIDPNIPTEWDYSTRPLSTIDPTTKLYNFVRPAQSSPSPRLDALRVQQETSSARRATNGRPVPTNAWYQNLLMLGENEEPSGAHKAYAMPYVVDVAGRIPGLRIHTFQKVTTFNTVNLNTNVPHALTLGAALDVRQQDSTQQFFTSSKAYSVKSATPLGVTLQWDYFPMTSSIVKGMPYATMVYAPFDRDEEQKNILPTIYSDVQLFGALVVDGTSSINCSADVQIAVEQEVQLRFQSGITWMLFFSRPAQLQCQKAGSRFFLQVVDDSSVDDSLVIRAAMVVPRDDQNQNEEEFSSEYKTFLKQHSNIYPGENTRVQHAVSDDKLYGSLVFDWDAQEMRKDSGNGELAMFALPHHQDKLKDDVQEDLCTISLLGPLCPILGGSWSMVEDIPEVSFQAPRHPDPEVLPAIAEALATDIAYQIPANFQLGAGDTYFSGKALAKLARILLVHEEVNELCQNPSEEYREVCIDAMEHMPAEIEVTMALEHLQKSVEIWLHGDAESPFVYDPAWGGVVSCGCTYSYGKCLNKVPNCPAFTDKQLNFGGGFYNDHHFHYGYHIYAAAALSHLNQKWGIKNFEEVLLLVRDFANPSPEDASFPIFRHKDWYQGHSWASGISVKFLNGMNQESSSEAIAAYEAVSLFGKSMHSAFRNRGDTELAAAADSVYKSGLILTATEIRSTQRYYQVFHSNQDKKIYPDVYEPNVVGILWSTMAHYGTWFGNNPYYIYGIQLLPLTPISESRDDVEWSKEMFVPYSKSCDSTCTSSGWSVGVLAILATIGQKQTALKQAQQLPLSVFETPGGGGHSKSNTLWYISTRPTIDDAYSLDDSLDDNEDSDQKEDVGEDLTCSRPKTCTETVLNTMADTFTCRDRIVWLMKSGGLSQLGACAKVAEIEFPKECGGCSPSAEVIDVDGPDFNDDPVDVEDPVDNDPTFCNRSSTCTDSVLDRMADGHTCRARMKWLEDTMKMSRWAACSQVAAQEFPAQCGPCDPDGN